MFNTIMNYFKQTSTYTGMATLLGIVGITMSDGLVQAISAVGIAVVGLIEVIRDERNGK